MCYNLVRKINDEESEVAPTDTWNPSERISPADAFTSFIKTKLNSYNLQPSESEKIFLDGLADDAYTKIFLDLVRKTAKQVSHSPLFNLSELEKINLLPDPLSLL